MRRRVARDLRHGRATDSVAAQVIGLTTRETADYQRKLAAFTQELEAMIAESRSRGTRP